MCNLSQGVYDEATVEHLKNLIKNKDWDLEECMTVLGIPENRKSIYRDIILDNMVTV